MGSCPNCSLAQPTIPKADTGGQEIRFTSLIRQVLQDGQWSAIAQYMLTDIRYSLRTLRQSPGFAFTAIISIALAIGANSAIFSMADALLLRPLPVPNSSQVVTLRARTPSGGFGGLSYSDYLDFREKGRSFDGLVAYNLVPVGFAVDSKTQPQLKMGFLASGNFFSILGVEPQLGRGFRPEEDQVPGRDTVIVLSHDLWKREFEANPSIIGKQIRLNGADFTVIGIAPESFTGMDQYVRPAFYVPAMTRPKLFPSSDALTNRSARGFTVKGRLRPGVSMRAAADEASVLAKSLEQSYPNTNRAFGATVRTEFQDRLDSDPFDPMLVGLMSALVMIVLAIACANVANLMLSRGRARARELGVRLAIGASRGRIIRQLMVESLVIAVAAGILGLILADFAVELFSTIQTVGDVPVRLDFQLDHRVLYFTILVSVLSAVLFGLVPALQSTKTDLVSAIKAGEADLGRKRFFGRNALVVVQIAGSVVLLVAATQLYRGFTYALTHDYGFRTDHRITMRIDPTLAGYSRDQTGQIFKTMVERAREVPGVKSAALSFSLPLTTNARGQTVVPEGFQFPAGQERAEVLSDTVDDNFFAAFGVPIISGRGFLPTDRADSPFVVVVNAQFAQHYLGSDPIGKRIRLVDRENVWAQVVGVSVTGKHISVFEPPLDFVYLPLGQHRESRMTLIAETYRDPAALAGPLRETIRSINPNLPIFEVRTMDDVFQQRSVKVANVIIGTVGAIGVMGIVLALVGLYAVVAYQVSRRTREIGIRMAIGAARSDVMKLILKQASTISLIGVCIGLALSLLAARGVNAGLATSGAGSELPLFHAAVFTLIPLALLATSVLAAAIPARRASRIDPQHALRQE
jgi:predicted permease